MRNLLFLFVLAIPILSYADAKKDKFGNIPIELVMQEMHSIESDAKSAILFQDIDVKITYDKGKDNWVSNIEVYKRIKIYDESETGRGDIVIRFYDYGRNSESVSGIKGYTHNLEGGRVKKTELSKNSIFEERSSRYYSAMKIAMPNIKKGSVIEIKYKIKSPILRIPRRFVQFDIPCDKTIYKVEVPEYFNFNTSTTGFVPMDVSEENSSDMVSFMTKTRTGVNTTSTTMGTENVNYRTTIKTFTTENTPSLKDEDFIPQMSNYRGSIKYELSGYSMPGVTYRNFLKSWDEIAKNLMEDSGFGGFLKQKKKELASVTDSWEALEGPQKAKAIYEYVQSEYTWNEYYGINSYDGLGDLLESHTGNTADINLLLIKLLRQSGFNAHPIVSRSRDRGFLNMYYPTKDELNYVMAALIGEDDQITLLDATSKSHYYGSLPPRSVNLKGVIITSENKGIPIDVKNPNKGKSVVLADVAYDEVDGLVYNCKMIKAKYDAIKLWDNKNEYTSDQEWYEHLEGQYDDREYDKIEVQFKEDISRGATMVQDYIDEYSSEMIGDELHIDCTLGFGRDSHPFKADKRDYPIFYNSTISNQHTVKFAIPNGYSVLGLPEGLNIALPTDAGRFSYGAVVQGETIVVQMKETINTDIIAAELYPALKEFYSQIVNKCGEKIVLKKL